MMFFLHIPLQH